MLNTNLLLNIILIIASTCFGLSSWPSSGSSYVCANLRTDALTAKAVFILKLPHLKLTMGCTFSRTFSTNKRALVYTLWQCNVISKQIHFDILLPKRSFNPQTKHLSQSPHPFSKNGELYPFLLCIISRQLRSV
jgi:hypothetical protein